MSWTHIILEAFCMRKNSLQKSKYHYKIISTKPFKTKKIPNPEYNPNYRTPKKPGYCPGIPQYKCFDKNCLHLALANADKKDYLWLNKHYKKIKCK